MVYLQAAESPSEASLFPDLVYTFMPVLTHEVTYRRFLKSGGPRFTAGSSK
jgi:hypothetical protein